MVNESELLNQYQQFLMKSTQIAIIGPLFDSSMLSQIDSSSPLLFIDGGINHLGLFPSSENESFQYFSIGDGDSTKQPLNLTLSQEKDFSDLSYALNILPETIEDIFLFGFLGGREDHLLANFGEIHQLISLKSHIQQLWIDGRIQCLPAGSSTFDASGTFSLLSLTSNKITLTGKCRYQAKEVINLKPLSSRSISNIGDGKVHLNNETTIFVFFNKEEY